MGPGAALRRERCRAADRDAPRSRRRHRRQCPRARAAHRGRSGLASGRARRRAAAAQAEAFRSWAQCRGYAIRRAPTRSRSMPSARAGVFWRGARSCRRLVEPAGAHRRRHRCGVLRSCVRRPGSAALPRWLARSAAAAPGGADGRREARMAARRRPRMRSSRLRSARHQRRDKGLGPALGAERRRRARAAPCAQRVRHRGRRRAIGGSGQSARDCWRHSSSAKQRRRARRDPSCGPRSRVGAAAARRGGGGHGSRLVIGHRDVLALPAADLRAKEAHKREETDAPRPVERQNYRRERPLRAGRGQRLFPARHHRPALSSSDSATTTECSWKGTAHYYTVAVDGAENKDAAWYYPDPKAAAANIKDHIAFWRGVTVER